MERIWCHADSFSRIFHENNWKFIQKNNLIIKMRLFFIQKVIMYSSRSIFRDYHKFLILLGEFHYIERKDDQKDIDIFMFFNRLSKFNILVLDVNSKFSCISSDILWSISRLFTPQVIKLAALGFVTGGALAGVGAGVAVGMGATEGFVKSCISVNTLITA